MPPKGKGRASHAPATVPKAISRSTPYTRPTTLAGVSSGSSYFPLARRGDPSDKTIASLMMKLRSLPGSLPPGTTYEVALSSVGIVDTRPTTPVPESWADQVAQEKEKEDNTGSGGFDATSMGPSDTAPLRLPGADDNEDEDDDSSPGDESMSEDPERMVDRAVKSFLMELSDALYESFDKEKVLGLALDSIDAGITKVRGQLMATEPDQTVRPSGLSSRVGRPDLAPLLDLMSPTESVTLGKRARGLVHVVAS